MTVAGILEPWHLPRRLESFLEKAGVTKDLDQAHRLIEQGRVSVTGPDVWQFPISAAMLVYPAEDQVIVKDDLGCSQLVDPRKQALPRTATVVAYNKPYNMVTSMKEPPSATSKPENYLAHQVRLLDEHLHPVGRLDRQTTGLLLLCNNGELTDLILRPGLVHKTYIATTKCPRKRGPTPEKLRALEDGVLLKDGMATASDVRLVKEEECALPDHLVGQLDPEYRFSISMTINEGRNRMVRRMMAAVGMPIKYLHRKCIGPVDIDLLGLHAPNQAKWLSTADMSSLWDAIGGDKVYLEYRLCTLLCRYRSSVCIGDEDTRLKAFLQLQWTIKGPCYGKFAKMNCPEEVRELHKQFHRVEEAPC
eukprot:CAMPEP_0114249872 /NCGR_PEP_ID=MMETSP0058-20121206/14392_1 /TAXON_ID=36894 /ORGANISM="Pyramimonas parkeae, CCMP726" /LENGTH=362 /DNA_ID=CAMNT_0001363483 /DNA_START=217 /DNA_END=1305 /DNA_ORIENTATION=-